MLLLGNIHNPYGIAYISSILFKKKSVYTQNNEYT